MYRKRDRRGNIGVFQLGANTVVINVVDMEMGRNFMDLSNVLGNKSGFDD